MRFEQGYIDQVREQMGDEAAAQLERANAEEDHRTRVESYSTDPTIAQKYPRMAYAIKNKQVQLPSFPDDAAAEAYVRQQEEFLATMGTPLPGQTPQNQPTPPPEGEEGQPNPRPVQADDLGRVPGMVPWSDGATQAVLTPSEPGVGATQLTIIVAEAEDLMEPEAGRFRRGRDRDFALIRAMEIANRMSGGTQELRQMRMRYMDPNIFPF